MITKILKNIEDNEWIYAKTMSKHPHWYTLRDNWKIDKNFIDFVLFIRKNGYTDYFYGKPYIVFNINGFKYWTMGYPIHNCPKTGTILINRAKVKYRADYDKIAFKYDDLFIDEKYINENNKLFELIKPIGNVLDIGCGTGLFLDYFKEYKDYIGIDISSNMLEILLDKHSNANIINTSLNDFYSTKKYDTVIGLYGVGSYLTKLEINKIYDLISDNGKIFMMHYKSDYYPDTYKKTGIECKRYIHEQNGLNKIEFNNYLIYTNENIS